MTPGARPIPMDYPSCRKSIRFKPAVALYPLRNAIEVVHDMSLTSTRLVGGSENKNGDIKLEVVYSRFRH